MANLSSLYLAPADPLACPAPNVVEPVLRDLKLLGAALDAHRYHAGEHFTRLVVYAGCSPYLITEPPADGGLQFCHIALHGPYPRPQLVTGRNTVAPRCPICRARFTDWRARLIDWRGDIGQAGCDNCGKTTPAVALDWRQQAVGARYLIELRNVYPGEATPSDRLMAALQAASSMPWRYAWADYLGA